MFIQIQAYRFTGRHLLGLINCMSTLSARMTEGSVTRLEKAAAVFGGNVAAVGVFVNNILYARHELKLCQDDIESLIKLMKIYFRENERSIIKPFEIILEEMRLLEQGPDGASSTLLQALRPAPTPDPKTLLY